MELPTEVTIREVGPRDGLQNEAVVDTAMKIRLLDLLSGTGVRRIEAVSFVKAEAIPQMSDAEQVWEGMCGNPEIEYSALVLNVRGAERAIDCGVDLIQFALSASETHNLRNTGRSVEKSLCELSQVVEIASSVGAPVHATVSTAWGCPYEGEIQLEAVVGVVKSAEKTGVVGISLGDTTGMGTPSKVRDLIAALVEVVASDTEINAHFHDTRGTGLANVVAALDAGCTSFDASVGGLGGCPYAPGATGNICTEDLVHMLDDMGIETGISLGRYLEVAEFAQELAGRELPSHMLKAGPRLPESVSRG